MTRLIDMKFLKSIKQGFLLLFVAVVSVATLQPTALAGCWRNVVIYCQNYTAQDGYCEGEPVLKYCVTTDSYVHAISANYPSGTSLLNYYQAQCNFTCSWQDCRTGIWEQETRQQTFQETSTFGPACTPPGS